MSSRVLAMEGEDIDCGDYCECLSGIVVLATHGKERIAKLAYPPIRYWFRISAQLNVEICKCLVLDSV